MQEITQTPPKKIKLKPLEKEFAKAYVKNNGNGTQTVKEVFDIEDDKYASVKSARLIGRDRVIQEIENVKSTLKSALEKQGITPEYLAEKVDVLLTAKDDKGNTDFNAVDKGLKHATNIYGVVDPQESKPQGNTYNFIFSAEAQEKIKIVDAQIKDLLRKKHD